MRKQFILYLLLFIIILCNTNTCFASMISNLEEDLQNFPQLILPSTYKRRNLPSEIDNSQLPYFRSIFSQTGNSCFFASAVGYNFTYEINYERGTPADIAENQYPTHFSYNFLNNGIDYGGASFLDIWKVLKENGTPNVADYGGLAAGGYRRWMSGYDEYYNGMHNKVSEYYHIDVGTPEGLETLKHWMNDHLDGGEAGGLANFWAGFMEMAMETVPTGTPQEGSSIVIGWGQDPDHAMTFVGYNDSIRYDYNNDGLYTNDIDINEDGRIDMKDWEIGAMIVANSHGTSWGDEGKAYMMYRLLAESTYFNGIFSNKVFLVRTKDYYEPLLTMKVTLKHTSRNKLKVMAGISHDLNAQSPDFIMDFSIFNHQGGSYYMQGGNSEEDKTIEFGLDITPLLNQISPNEPAKIFLIIEEDDPYNFGTGEIVSFSVMDYNDGVVEIACEDVNTPLNENNTTMLSVNAAFDFTPPVISNETLPVATSGEFYTHCLSGTGGASPYYWDIAMNYTEEEIDGEFVEITTEELIPAGNPIEYLGYSVAKNIGFSFPFYGESYDTIFVGGCGGLFFEPDSLIPCYYDYEHDLKTHKVIAPYLSEIYIIPHMGGGMWYEGNEDYALFRWKCIYPDQSGVNMSAKLYPNGDIEFSYGHVNSGWDFVAGISDGNKNHLISNHSNGYLSDDYTVRYSSTDYAVNFPIGVHLSSEGEFWGTPIQNNIAWDIPFRITDENNLSTTKIMPFTIGDVKVESPNFSTIPKNVILHQNYPNPFNPTTTIKYDVPHSANVSLKIYDISGRLVKTLINDKKEAGYHSVVWDGKDENGQNIPSGLYLYKIDSESFSNIRQMLLLK